MKDEKEMMAVRVYNECVKGLPWSAYLQIADFILRLNDDKVAAKSDMSEDCNLVETLNAYKEIYCEIGGES